MNFEQFTDFLIRIIESNKLYDNLLFLYCVTIIESSHAKWKFYNNGPRAFNHLLIILQRVSSYVKDCHGPWSLLKKLT